MIVADLMAALPAAIVTALASDPQGITAAGKVHVADKRPPMPSGDTAMAWVHSEPRRLEAAAEGLSSTIVTYEVEVRLSSSDGSADLESWGDLMREAFHGLANPSSVARLIVCSVDVAYDPYTGDSGANECLVTLTFAGSREK